LSSGFWLVRGWGSAAVVVVAAVLFWVLMNPKNQKTFIYVLSKKYKIGLLPSPTTSIQTTSSTCAALNPNPLPSVWGVRKWNMYVY
jgi:hypothetical protein